MPHSTCTPCGLVPHFHKSLGLHLTRGERERGRKKKKHLLQLQENTKHEEYCIMPLSCRHSYEVTHDISIRALTCCVRTQSIKHPTACSKSQHRLQCGAKPIKRVFLREGGKETRSQSATNEGVNLNIKKNTFLKALEEPEHERFIRGDRAGDLQSCLDSQSLSILSNAARLNPSRWNMAAPYRQDQLFVASRRSERDLNDPCNIEGLGLPSYLSQPLRGMLHVIFWLCGQELIPPLPSPRGTWRQQQDTLGRLQQDEALSQIASATPRLCNLSSSSSGHTSWKQMNSHLCCYSQEACNIVRGYNSL